MGVCVCTAIVVNFDFERNNTFINEEPFSEGDSITVTVMYISDRMCDMSYIDW